MRDLLIDDPNISLADLMTLWPQTISVFVKYKMLCVGCLVSPFHTIADACAEYHLDEKAFISELKKAAGIL
ncbi:DUF1858 domain-containing protein [Marivita sp. XM-24bin2]|jgi:hybrid cluster-associated redox disulfide protein|uniref:DUF1858 domain-containing protein n=1 Tax=unclassified Marivita TaxID=2632480 RepID=UPI000D7B5DDA|nr:DUF1858 domain-containing protein [Marivita sp. XM-24bin2]MCR9110720.1 DUF1858 domain-containing protein [Paracoccaceae bacterium]PWL33397.1 MAG: hypothetical protein DCO97_19820 [Marivita sp. XM-24bin2]